MNRRGLGKMKHLQIKDLWLQKEVREGNLEVSKISGKRNPADLMTKILRSAEVKERLSSMGLSML